VLDAHSFKTINYHPAKASKPKKIKNGQLLRGSEGRGLVVEIDHATAWGSNNAAHDLLLREFRSISPSQQPRPPSKAQKSSGPRMYTEEEVAALVGNSQRIRDEAARRERELEEMNEVLRSQLEEAREQLTKLKKDSTHMQQRVGRAEHMMEEQGREQQFWHEKELALTENASDWRRELLKQEEVDQALKRALALRDSDVTRLTGRLASLERRHAEVLDRAHSDALVMAEELDALRTASKYQLGDKTPMPLQAPDRVPATEIRGDQTMLARKVEALQHELGGTREQLHRATQENRQLQGQVVMKSRELDALRSRQQGGRGRSYAQILPSAKLGCVEMPATGMTKDMVQLHHHSKALDGVRSGIGW